MIKVGGVPEAWKSDPAKLRQKDLNARWTKKHGRSYHGHKNHISVGRRHKLIRRHTVTDAARSDGRELNAVLEPANTARSVLRAWPECGEYRPNLPNKSII